MRGKKRFHHQMQHFRERYVWEIFKIEGKFTEFKLHRQQDHACMRPVLYIWDHLWLTSFKSLCDYKLASLENFGEGSVIKARKTYKENSVEKHDQPLGGSCSFVFWSHRFHSSSWSRKKIKELYSNILAHLIWSNLVGLLWPLCDSSVIYMSEFVASHKL